MPDPFPIVEDKWAIQYDGSNSAQILSYVPMIEFVSETGGVLTVESPPDSATWNINTNDFVVVQQGAIASVANPGLFNFSFDCNVTCDTLPLSPASAQAIGVAAVPTLLLGGSTTVAVTLQPAMPSTSYTAYANKFAAVSLLNLVINSVTIVDEETVNVNVSNTGLVTLSGASVMVHAVA